jgi:hypothetical protein
VGVRERDRNACGRGVAVALDAVDDAVGREAEALADRPKDPAVGLVVDEQVDLRQRDPGAGRDLQGDLAQASDGGAKSRASVHADFSLGVRGEDMRRPGRVGPEEHRADGPGASSANDRCPGAVAE